MALVEQINMALVEQINMTCDQRVETKHLLYITSLSIFKF